MLVLTRKPGESLIIGDQVEITVLENHSNEVKLGIKAPRSVIVLRKEIYEDIRNENAQAAGGNQPLPADFAKRFKKGDR